MSANEKNEIVETYPDLLLNLSDPHHLAAVKHAATLSRGERSAVVMSTKKKDEGGVHFLAAQALHVPARAAVLVATLMRRCGVAAEPFGKTSVRASWPDVYRKRQMEPIEFCLKTIDMCGVRGDATADFVAAMVARLVGLKPHPDPDAHGLALEAFRHPSEPTGEERTLITSADGSNELTIVPTGEGWVVRIVEDDPGDGEYVERERGVEVGSEQRAIEKLRENIRKGVDARTLITPVIENGNLEGWTIHEIPATQKLEVLVGKHASNDDERECVAALYRAMGGECSEPEERALDVGREDVVLVHERPYAADGERRTLRDVFPSDMLEALREVSKLCEGMPGDPGRNVCAVERVRAVLKTFDGMRRRGER